MITLKYLCQTKIIIDFDVNMNYINTRINTGDSYYFHISLLYGAHERTQTKLDSDAFGTKVVFRPEKFTMRADMSQKRMKLVIEGTPNWIYKGKKLSFDSLRRSLRYVDPCPIYYVPHITVGYCRMNKEEIKLNPKPLVEKYLNMSYLQLSVTEEINGGLFAVQLAGEKFWIERNSCTRCPA